MIRRKKRQYRPKEPRELKDYIKTIIGISPLVIGVIFIFIADYSGNTDWILYAVLVCLLFPVLFLLQKLIHFFDDKDLSIIHVVAIILIVIVLYNLIVPEDYFSKLLNPEEYWEKRITTLERSIKNSEKFLYDISTSIRSKDYEKEYVDMLYRLMNSGLPEDSAAVLIGQILKTEILVNETLLRSSIDLHNENLRLLKEARSQYEKIKASGEQ